jgi:hypothetical protein
MRFGEVTENFDCSYNDLTSLEGSPQTVGGDFYCNHNQLTSLEGAPQTVSGDFYFPNNQLTSLEGAPQTVNGNFYCNDNQLTSLEGAPQTVSGNFYCSDNPVPEKWIEKIYDLMRGGIPYNKSVEKLWNKMNQNLRVILYQPSFDWLSSEESRKIQLIKKYIKFKDFI